MLPVASGIYKLFDEALAQRGEVIATEFLKFRTGVVDSQQSYMLVHINPPVADNGDYKYSGWNVYSFASDFIFQRLVEKHRVQMLAGAAETFNDRTVSESYAAVSLGKLFEKICLWLKPLNGQRIVVIEWCC